MKQTHITAIVVGITMGLLADVLEMKAGVSL